MDCRSWDLDGFVEPALKVCRESCRILDGNSMASERYGYSRSEWRRLSLLALHPASERRAVKTWIGFPKKPPQRFTHLSKAGEAFPIQMNVIAASRQQGVEAVVLIQDILPDRQCHTRSPIEDGLYETIFDQTFDGLLIVGSDGKIVSANVAGARMLGCTQKELLGRHCLELLGLQPIGGCDRRLHERLLADYELPVQEVVFRRKDGTPLPAEIRAGVLRGNVETPVLIQIALRDISVRKGIEKKLRQSEAFLRSVIENQNDLIVRLDPEGVFEYVSPSCCELFGRTRGELIGRSCITVIHQDDHAQAADVLLSLRTPPHICKLEQRVRTREGWRWLEWSDKAILDETGKVIGIAAIGRDIAQRKATEAKAVTRRNLQDMISEISHRLVMSDELDLAAVLHRLREISMFERVFLVRLQPERFTHGIHRVLEQAKLGDPSITDVRISTGELHALSSAFLQSEIRLIRQQDEVVEGLAFERRLLTQLGVEAMFEIPWFDSRYQLIALLCLESQPLTESHEFQISYGLQLRSLGQLLSSHLARLESLESLTESNKRLQKLFDQLATSLGAVVKCRDPYTADHQLRVSRIAESIGQSLGLDQDTIEGLRVASLLHDIGKLTIPAELLSKPGQLSDVQKVLIHSHAEAGYEILKEIDFRWPVAQIVLQHHERLDGSGYPNHLVGEEILFEAKILAVADTIDAMNSHRPYRPALGIEKALEEIAAGRGSLYDKRIVDACLVLHAKSDLHGEI